MTVLFFFNYCTGQTNKWNVEKAEKICCIYVIHSPLFPTIIL